jgi:hypothetical protein
MLVAIVLVVGSVLLVVSAFTWVARRETVERAGLLGTLRPRSVAGLEANVFAAVRARAVTESPVLDPVTREPVVFCEGRVTKLDGTERTLRAWRDGSTAWLEDDSGRVAVSLEGADLTLPWEELEPSDDEPSPRMRQLLEEGGFPVPALERGARYAIFQRVVRSGDLLTVVGRPRASERGSLRFVADEEGLVVSASELDALQERERADLRSMTRMLQLGAALGALLIALGVALLASR